MKLPISLVIVTFNEEENLKRCLDAADFCSQIVVVDSGSTDGTIHVAEKAGATVLTRAWQGYGPQKNFAMEHATEPWILCIDADEVVSPELRGSIIEAFERESECDGFDINRHGVYSGQKINFSGWYPQWRTFLFRNGKAVWVGAEPHVVVQFRGGTKRRLKGDLYHFTYRSIDEHIRKNVSSARAASVAMFQNGRRPRWYDLVFRPAWAWVKSFIIQQGFRDGFLGLVIANGQFHYTFLKYAFLEERCRTMSNGEKRTTT